MATRKAPSTRHRYAPAALNDAEEKQRADAEAQHLHVFPDYTYNCLRGYAPPYSLFSAFAFSWFNPVINAGARAKLQLSQTLTLPTSLTSSQLFDDLTQGRPLTSRMNVRQALMSLAGFEFLVAGLYRFLTDILALLLTYVLRRLMQSMQGTGSGTRVQDTLNVLVLLFIVSVAQSLTLQQFIHGVFMAGARVSTAATSLVLHASLRLKLHSKHSDWEGRVSNILAKDAQSLREFVVFAHNLWAAPLVVVGSIALLVSVIGPAAIVGVFGMLIFIPIENAVNAKSKTLRKETLKISDSRMSQIYDLLDGIRTVKLANLISALSTRITELRGKELRQQALATSLSVFNRALMASAPAVVAVFTFATYFVLGSSDSKEHHSWWSVPPLTPDRAFTAIALLGQLSHPFKVMPKCIQLFADANVSVGRIQSMLEETQSLTYADENEHGKNEEVRLNEEPSVELANYSVSRASSGDSFCLDKLTEKFDRGLNMVIGMNAAGKTTLLMGILSELRVISGTARIKPHGARVAFASSDSTWIINDTARANIILASASVFNDVLYNEVVEACALNRDFKEWSHGDKTMIGEKGITLSGGQRARICLARAMYSQCPVILLDTPLASVDSVVGQHVFQNAVLKMAQTRCVIMVTHNRQYVPHADKVFFMKEGSIPCRGPFKSLPAYALQTMGEAADQSFSTKKSLVSDSSTRQGSFTVKDKKDTIQDTKSKPDDEEKWLVQGQKENVVRAYLSACGWGLTILTMTLTVSSHFLGAWKDSLLAEWSRNSANAGRYLWIFTCGSIVVIASNFAKMYSLMWAGLSGSKLLHQRMLSSILGAPIQFFDVTPSGRIANRFSADIDTIDNSLPEGILAMAEAVLSIITGVGVVVISTPTFILFLGPLLYCYIQIQQLYRLTSKELKVLDSSTKSPIFSHCRETLDGLESIRGYQIQDFVILKYNHLMDQQLRARLNWDAANRWLGIRLDLIATLIISSAALVVFLGVQSGQVDPGYGGYALAFSLGATKGFGFAVRSMTALENTFVACDRVLQYTRLKQEEELTQFQNRSSLPPENQPLLNHGDDEEGIGSDFGIEVLVVTDLVVRYGPDLPNALDGVSLTVLKGHTIGICGRTGCGKSTLSVCLARGVEAASGQVLVRGVDASTLSLHHLRAQVQVFPQDSYVFAGTIAEVIDPWKKASSSQLQYIADELLQLFVQDTSSSNIQAQTPPDLLQFKVEKGGGNLSAGQRQLLSLARACLSDAVVVVLDECCSQMDPSISHGALSFVKRTLTARGTAVLLIAHRLDDIADCDSIIVLERGRIEEQGSPQSLLRNPAGRFASLVASMGQEAQSRVTAIAMGRSPVQIN